MNKNNNIGTFVIFYIKNDLGGVRTHASRDTGPLNQRLRPLGHQTSHLKTYSLLFSYDDFLFLFNQNCVQNTTIAK